MTPKQGRSEWQRWASRADELLRDVERYEAMQRDFKAESEEAWWNVSRALSNMRDLLTFIEERRDGLREYAPKVTT